MCRFFASARSCIMLLSFLAILTVATSAQATTTYQPWTTYWLIATPNPNPPSPFPGSSNWENTTVTDFRVQDSYNHGGWGDPIVMWPPGRCHVHRFCLVAGPRARPAAVFQCQDHRRRRVRHVYGLGPHPRSSC